jgi:hypothetical protein
MSAPITLQSLRQGRSLRSHVSGSQPEHVVKVRRQPGDYRLATYPLEKVYRMRCDNVGGGIQQRSAMHVYGYVLCNELTGGKLAHSCRHGPPPHEIKVCITKKHNEQVWPRILEMVGPKLKRSTG